ncbi:MAG: ABC transporter permease [Pseudomonadota bacterium]
MISLSLFEFFGGAYFLVMDVSREIWRRPFYLKLVFEQVYQIGVRSLPLVFVTGLSTGMVMALQFGLGL